MHSLKKAFAFNAKTTYSKIVLKTMFDALFVPWSSPSRGGFASVHRTQIAVIWRRVQNTATSPINVEMDR
jgi:hypothetical protein